MFLCCLLFMAALWNRAGHYIFPCVFFRSSFFFLFFSPDLRGRRLDVYPYFYTWCGPSANLECRSEMCCMRLAGNAGPKKLPEIRDLGTITQICRAISSHVRHVLTIWKKRVKQQYLLHMSSQYGELWPLAIGPCTNGWDRLAIV